MIVPTTPDNPLISPTSLGEGILIYSTLLNSS